MGEGSGFLVPDGTWGPYGKGGVLPRQITQDSRGSRGHIQLCRCPLRCRRCDACLDDRTAFLRAMAKHVVLEVIDKNASVLVGLNRVVSSPDRHGSVIELLTSSHLRVVVLPTRVQSSFNVQCRGQGSRKRHRAWAARVTSVRRCRTAGNKLSAPTPWQKQAVCRFDCDS